MHPFERAKLGNAPFRYVGTYTAKWQACPGAPIQPGAACDYCGQGIMQVFRVRSADGREFKVGCDCVAKVYREYGNKTDGVDAKVKAAVAKARKASAANSLERRVIAVCTALETDPTFLTDVPHPQEWAARKGMTMRDMVSWYLDHAGAAGKTKVLKIAEKYLKETD
jgi:hypothetical protein